MSHFTFLQPEWPDVQEAAAATMEEFDAVTEKDPAAKETIEAMRSVWADGIAGLR